MNPLRTIFILGVAFMAFHEALPAQPPTQDADSQLWSETRLIYKLNDKFDIFTAGSYRLTDGFTDFHRVSARVGFTWAPTPPLIIAPSYFYTVANPWTSFPRPENRVCLLTVYRFDIDKGFLAVGNTTEYRMPEYGQDAFWLRPRIRFQYPVGRKTWGCPPSSPMKFSTITAAESSLKTRPLRDFKKR